MITDICFASAFLIEAFISFYYFGTKFESKVKNVTLILTFTLFGILSFVFSRVNNSIPILNIILYIVTNYLILTFCYRASLKSKIFNTLVLTALMIVSETIVMSFLNFLFDSSIEQIVPNDTYLISLSVLSKLVFFFTIYFLTKFTTKEKNQDSFVLPAFLCVLPISSIMWVVCTHRICLMYEIVDYLKIILSVCNILILLTNIIVFYVYEYTLKTNRKYTELVVIQQKEKDSVNYYELLKEQNENSKILIHDITKHLNTIKQLSENKDSNITQYISDIVDDFSVMNPVDYCSNPIVNLITHRYYDICKKNNISFTININNADIDFMKEHDITALLDNLLENAVEAAIQSDEKFIDFSIVTRNSNFVIIKISNSCINKPKYKNGVLISSKKTKDMHGIGTRSIRRVVSKYNGNLDMNYDSNTNTFTSVICINTNLHN